MQHGGLSTGGPGISQSLRGNETVLHKGPFVQHARGRLAQLLVPLIDPPQINA
jgi:hypothetical protein